MIEKLIYLLEKSHSNTSINILYYSQIEKSYSISMSDISGCKLESPGITFTVRIDGDSTFINGLEFTNIYDAALHISDIYYDRDGKDKQRVLSMFSENNLYIK